MFRCRVTSLGPHSIYTYSRAQKLQKYISSKTRPWKNAMIADNFTVDDVDWPVVSPRLCPHVFLSLKMMKTLEFVFV